MSERPESTNERPGGMATLITIAAGVGLIAILTPLAQFLTAGAGHASVETSTPTAWAVGLVVSLVLVYAMVRLLARIRIPKGHLVILYTMLTVAVPLMNLGLVRQAYLSISSAYFEYFYYGTSTYRTAYNARGGDWFPHVPDREGLAWNRADRLLRLLTDVTAVRERNSARRELNKHLGTAAQLGAGNVELPPLEPLIERLGADQVSSVLETADEELLRRLGIEESLRERYQEAAEASDRALEQLTPMLMGRSEYAASLLPENLAEFDYSSRQRLESQLAALSESERAALREQAAAMEEELGKIQGLLFELTEGARAQLRDRLMAEDLKQLAQLSAEERAELQNSFVFRLTREERRTVFGQDGSNATPNQNLSGARMGLWSDLAGQQERQRQSFAANIREVVDRIPWDVWTGPILRWSLLFLSLFLFLMCLAEWFRRKWVDRENLAFPLVEVADNIIRHDYELETAPEVTQAGRRSRLFNPLFLMGGLLGLVFLSMEAAAHYEIIGEPLILRMDVTQEIFAAGPLRDISEVVFVLSPIVVGLLFLVNLEISFSIWAIFLMYKVVFWMIGSAGTFKDSLWVGYGGGRNFPFEMEQLMGATLCFGLILIFKSAQGILKSNKQSVEMPETGSFISPKLNRIGLAGLPVIIIALVWSLGVTSPVATIGCRLRVKIKIQIPTRLI